SRQLIGYVALVGVVTVMSHLHAALGASMFVLPLTVLLALSASRFARRLFGPAASFWMLLTIPLTFSFLRLPDARGTVLAAPLLFLALTPDTDTSPRRRALTTAVVLGVLVYVHPLLGAMTIVAHVIIALLTRDTGFSLAGVMGALVLSVPQVATMAGASLPSWTPR